MKTRIISGALMIAGVAAVLTVGFLWQPLAVTAFLALISAGAIYELTHNAAGIKAKAAYIGAVVYAFLMPFALDGTVCKWIYTKNPMSPDAYLGGVAPYQIAIVLSVLYFLYAAATVLKYHAEFSLSKIAVLCGLPFPYCVAFACLGGVINHDNGLYYLLLLFNSSAVCDTGAYFTGVTCGKRKLCPEISPKKTVEGAVGGVVLSLIVSIVLLLCFDRMDHFAVTVILTVPLCLVSMMGDLFASCIKRAVDLKDYSGLIPGHGGILDRVDSILMTAPVVYLCVLFGVL